VTTAVASARIFFAADCNEPEFVSVASELSSAPRELFTEAISGARLVVFTAAIVAWPVVATFLASVTSALGPVACFSCSTAFLKLVTSEQYAGLLVLVPLLVLALLLPHPVRSAAVMSVKRRSSQVVCGRGMQMPASHSSDHHVRLAARRLVRIG